MSRWTIGKKITTALITVLIQAMAIGGYAVWRSMRADQRLSLVTKEYLPEAKLAASIERELLNARIHFIYFVTIQKPGALDKGWERFHSAQNELPKLVSMIEQSEGFGSVRPEAKQLQADIAAYQPVLERIIGVVRDKRNTGPEFDALINQWATLGGRMVDSAGRLYSQGLRCTKQWEEETASQHTTVALMCVCVAGALFGSLLTFFVARGISRTLRGVCRRLSCSAQQVAETASQIGCSAHSIAEGASSQAAALEQTSASSEEISSMAVQNTRDSASAAGNMAQTSTRIEEANATLHQMIESMDQINVSSDKISKIIKVIDEIAFQTNILALNAAVEAARAGEAGMGFAVVAEEVRNLAQRVAQAAKDTTGLIEESITRSGDGKNKLNRMAAAIHAITDESAKVKFLVDQLNKGSQEQERGVQQISRAVAHVGEVTQKAAATAAESASASGELRAQSAALKQAVDQLTAMVGAE